MRGVVFLFFHPTRQSWGVETSVAPFVDYEWYREKGYLHPTVITPYLPLYVVYYWKNCYQSELERDPVTDPGAISFVLDRLERRKQKEFERFPVMYEKMERIAKRSDQYTQLIPFPHLQMDQIKYDANLILPHIIGRHWFVELLERRLKMVGVHLASLETSGISFGDYLTYMLQYLYLEGEVELVSGITIHPSGNQLEMKCERCGSINRRIHMQYCTYCKDEDLACDVCYALGTSKGCSLIVSRGRPISTVHESSEYYRTGTNGGFGNRLLKWTGRL